MMDNVMIIIEMLKNRARNHELDAEELAVVDDPITQKELFLRLADECEIIARMICKMQELKQPEPYKKE